MSEYEEPWDGFPGSFLFDENRPPRAELDQDALPECRETAGDRRTKMMTIPMKTATRSKKPYHLASRDVHPESTVIQVGDVRIGGAQLVVMAGPCAVESHEQLLQAAYAVRAAGATLLRGGAFKPRTSPYDFQGLGEEGLQILAEARERTGLRIVTEVVDTEDVAVVARYADVLQIGSRNMSAFRLLQKAAETGKPIMLKRGFQSTIKEWLLSAEYVLASGNNQVILCERGIRTYDTEHTRNTLDLTAVPVLKRETHLPVIVDPSHGTGRTDLVGPLSKAAVVVGADGLLLEVHPDPSSALCDGQQSLSTSEFHGLMDELRPMAELVGRYV
ncbi:MAG: 3-deoxy-7-phosphoheptulonate synthase [Chloroflexota bacterium]|nr:MAG: 3-deoxy-7-phosphoheptulonate synthase [Chloroflexota bacterium]